MAILVIAEHDNQSLKASTLNTVAAAARLGGDVHMLVAGAGCAGVAEAAAKVAGVAKVLVCDAAHYEAQTAENVAELVKGLAAGYSHVLAPATPAGKNNAAARRRAARRGADQRHRRGRGRGHLRMRPIYAGNALATVKSADAVKVITVRTTAFDVAAADGNAAAIEAVAAAADLGVTALVSREIVKSARPELGAAKIIVSGGRGLGQRRRLPPVARAARRQARCRARCASRAAVDAGYVPNDYQVGQTGKIVAPQLYIAVGISGAIQHLAGMKDSKVIVAINKDPEAPIFQVADYGLVGDLFQVVPELTSILA